MQYAQIRPYAAQRRDFQRLEIISLLPAARRRFFFPFPLDCVTMSAYSPAQGAAYMQRKTDRRNPATRPLTEADVEPYLDI